MKLQNTIGWDLHLCRCQGMCEIIKFNAKNKQAMLDAIDKAALDKTIVDIFIFPKTKSDDRASWACVCDLDWSKRVMR